MHTIQIRNVPDELYKKLVESAQKNHRSLSRQVLYLLETAIGSPSTYDAGTLLREISIVREEIGKRYGTGPSSVDSIREDRSR